MQPPSREHGLSMRDSAVGGDVNISHVHHHAHHQNVAQGPEGTTRDEVAIKLAQIQQNLGRATNPELAALISFVFPGAGYIQLGYYVGGFGTLFLAFFLLALNEIGFIMYIAMGLSSAFHSYALGHKMNGDRVHI
jgi:hypothetical protein